MKTRKKTISLVSAALMSLTIACTNNQPKIQTKPVIDSTIIPDTLLTIGSVFDATNDSVVQLTFQSKDTAFVILGKLKGPQQHLTISIPVQANSQLTAALVPVDSTANIRFAQVVYPNGKAGGPFNKEISFPVRQTGSCKLIVAHNLMTEAELTKLFKLHVKLSPLPLPKQ